jgi:predicted small lipoprotein YifL
MRALFVALAVLALAACGERGQEPVAGERSYQGKQDSRPWDNEPLAAEYRGGKWSKGDQASWETQIKARQLAQHEHKRIYQ